MTVATAFLLGAALGTIATLRIVRLAIAILRAERRHDETRQDADP